MRELAACPGELSHERFPSVRRLACAPSGVPARVRAGVEGWVSGVREGAKGEVSRVRARPKGAVSACNPREGSRVERGKRARECFESARGRRPRKIFRLLTLDTRFLDFNVTGADIEILNVTIAISRF